MKTNKIFFIKIAEHLQNISSIVGQSIYAYKHPGPVNIAYLSKTIVDKVITTTMVSQINKMYSINSGLKDIIINYAKECNEKTTKIKYYSTIGILYEMSNGDIIIDLGNESLSRCSNENISPKVIAHYLKKFNNSIYIYKIPSNGDTYDNDILIEEDILYEPKTNKLIKKISKKMEKYRSSNVGCRSTLFYGEPGSGKSTLIKSICSSLDLRSLRIPANIIKSIPSKIFEKITKNTSIDTIIIEDIDKIIFTIEMLEFIDSIKNNLDFILFSANNKDNINKAFMRMGRIDEIIEINGTDFETAMDILEDENLANQMKNLPVVCMLELSKRIKALGKEVGVKEFMKENDRIKKFISANNDNE